MSRRRLIRFHLSTSGARTRGYVTFNFILFTWTLRIF